ncbi:phosphatase PAP2 family protein [Candidatus Nitrosocosmicus agrestis]|uniref:phosphatase PAP2 family protein n=1 Tax=Candidatus Nitrosocosmicus agrestis TaxID=2563600 RepID=UPI00122E22DE|nr:phosphatase PAP2 family protein [Candidatus Nitrosocosmicus sp. SS]KAA2283107.1 phosphatase PAP2 family protein [Candidatus Nitrosocosmicus sp. SS]KAF0868563.1 phosphatase PAP2 family protein [Candidatus Nitrosocosmicus sp. SS]
MTLFFVLALVVSPVSFVNNRILSQYDSSMLLIIVNSHHNSLNQFMIYLTIYGRETFWILVIILLLIIGKKRGKRVAAMIILVMIVLVPIGIIAKQIVERPRPTIPESDFLIPADTEYAFPSGHALIVSAGAAISISLYRNSYKELAISIMLTAEAGLVCFSRVYVGGHYPFDVLGGIFLGIGISFLFIWKQDKLELLYQQLSKMIFELRQR